MLRQIMFLRIAIPVFFVFFLYACQTLSGVQQDMQDLLDSGSAAFSGEPAETEEGEPGTLQAKNAACPPLSLIPDLNKMIEFRDMAKPSEKTELARLTISDVSAVCNIQDDNLVMDITFVFDGKLGPMARIKDTDRTSFAFPYFVAVTGPKGGVLSKEIFAASMLYESDEEQLQLVETISQSMPLAEDGSTPPYKVITGFQLASEQLAYNRTQAGEN